MIVPVKRANFPSGGRPAVFLDRDGVLNKALTKSGRPYPPAGIADFEIIEGVEQACLSLKGAGFLLIVVTNQPDISRGKTRAEDVNEINQLLRSRLPLDDIRVCPHDDDARCMCRKPKPGLLFAAADEHGVDLRRSVMVGDRWRDISAGTAAGCRTVFIDYGYDERRPETPDHIASSLIESIPFIVQ